MASPSSKGKPKLWSPGGAEVVVAPSPKELTRSMKRAVKKTVKIAKASYQGASYSLALPNILSVYHQDNKEEAKEAEPQQRTQVEQQRPPNTRIPVASSLRCRSWSGGDASVVSALTLPLELLEDVMSQSFTAADDDDDGFYDNDDLFLSRSGRHQFNGDVGMVEVVHPHCGEKRTMEPIVFGLRDTWEAVKRDRHISVQCLTCTKNLCSVKEAAYVLCPSCQHASPNTPRRTDSWDYSSDDEGFVAKEPSRGGNGGVAMGLAFADLVEWTLGVMFEDE